MRTACPLLLRPLSWLMVMRTTLRLQVEVKQHPELRGKPVGVVQVGKVGQPDGRSVRPGWPEVLAES